MPCTSQPHRRFAAASIQFGQLGLIVSRFDRRLAGGDRDAAGLFELEILRPQPSLCPQADQWCQPFDNYHAGTPSRALSRELSLHFVRRPPAGHYRHFWRFCLEKSAKMGL